MAEASENLMFLRPGGATGINPFAAFSQGAGGRVAPQKVCKYCRDRYSEHLVSMRHIRS
jgi:hypothetical protein